MIDFKNRDDLPANVILIGSIVVMIGAGLFVSFAPKPARALPDAVAKQKKSQLSGDIIYAKDRIKEDQALIAKQTWSGTPEEVLPLALDRVTKIAQKHHLKLIGFHPQKEDDAPSVSLIPSIVNVDGPFTEIVGFERDIEAPGTNLAVNLMQLSTSDQESNKVTASIGIVAYQPVKPVKAPASAAGGSKNA